MQMPLASIPLTKATFLGAASHCNSVSTSNLTALKAAEFKTQALRPGFFLSTLHNLWYDEEIELFFALNPVFTVHKLKKNLIFYEIVFQVPSLPL